MQKFTPIHKPEVICGNTGSIGTLCSGENKTFYEINDLGLSRITMVDGEFVSTLLHNNEKLKNFSWTWQNTVLKDGNIYFIDNESNRNIHKIDVLTGEVKVVFVADSSVITSPIVLLVDCGERNMLAFATTGVEIYGLCLNTGELKKFNNLAYIDDMAYYNGNLYFLCGGTLIGYNLDVETPKLDYIAEELGDVERLIIKNNFAYFFTKQTSAMIALNLKNVDKTNSLFKPTVHEEKIARLLLNSEGNFNLFLESGELWELEYDEDKWAN